MADANEKVLAMMEKELTANPDISNEELRGKAEKIDSSISELNPRQFNARYPLQVKRRMKPTRRGAGKARGSAGKGRKRGGRSTAASKAASARGASAGRAGARGASGRDTVRGVLLELARDVASADGKAQIVDVIAGVDEYVDRVLKARA